MIKIPTKKIKGNDGSPVSMTITGPPKTGKTHLLTTLEGNLMLDLESGAKYYDALKIDVKQEVINKNLEIEKENIKLEELGKPLKPKYSKGRALHEITQQLKKNPVKYLTIDTVQQLEDVAKEVALIRYRQSIKGKSYKGSDLYDLPMGAGYGLVRSVFVEFLTMFEGCYTDCIFFISHVKFQSYNKDGVELDAKDISLTGKLKEILAAQVDSNAFLFRNDKGQNILSFKKMGDDLITGSRSPVVSNREFIISELVDDTVVTYWEKIFK